MPKKVDDNQPEIVQALRDVGATVLHLHTLGSGAPDICVGFRGDNYLIEIKDGNKIPSKRRLTPDEVEFHASWRGKVSVAESVEEALEVIGVV